MALAQVVRRSAGRVVTYDVFPEFSIKVRAFVLSPLGILLLATGVAILCGFVLHPRVFALAGGLVAVMAAGICWPWITARGVRATLGFEQRRVSEGEHVSVSMTVSNHLPWPAWGLTTTGGFESKSIDALLRLGSIPTRARLLTRYQLMIPLRGEYPVGPVHIATGFPFGIREARRGVAVSSRVIVWPRTFPVGPVPVTDGDEVVEGNVTRNKVGSTGDVLGVRPYRRGDSPRRIHWTQSARHDRLIVCELQSNSRPVVLLVLDADSTIHTAGAEGTSEWAIRVVASLAKGWLEAGAQVGIATSGLFLPPASGLVQSTRILDALARLNTDTGVSLPELLKSPVVVASRSATRVVVTTDRHAKLPEIGSYRSVVLQSAGFGGSRHSSSFTPWLSIPNPESIPHRLRYGWSEARHGS